jgi:anti-sigma regulatory factor (Ser/Thr protein kinase)
LQRWGVAERCDEITTVISELVTNALRYGLPAAGGWPIRVGLLQPAPGSGVLCAVADSNPAAPVLWPLGDPGESGRGLHVVQGLSDSWGCTASGLNGKVVWATFGTVQHAATVNVGRPVDVLPAT